MARKALSIIEVFLAVLVFMVGVGAVVISFMGSQALIEKSKELTIVSSHAQYILEEIKESAISGEDFIEGIRNGNWSWGCATIVARGLECLTGENITTSVEDENEGIINVTVKWNWKGNHTIERIFKTKIFQ